MKFPPVLPLREEKYVNNARREREREIEKGKEAREREKKES